MLRQSGRIRSVATLLLADLLACTYLAPHTAPKLITL
jgi:hypothetical protein